MFFRIFYQNKFMIHLFAGMQLIPNIEIVKADLSSKTLASAAGATFT
jgi:hypothetical protein